MRVYRLTRAPYAALDGKGSLTRSGRWHTKGNPIVYASSSRAMALLEYLVNLSAYHFPADLVFLSIDVLDSLILPLVPSVVVSEESNILLNPLHRSFALINLTASHPFQPDPRFSVA